MRSPPTRLAPSGDEAGAIDAYRNAVELEPEYVFAIRRLAYALSRVGQHGESLALFERASVLNSLAWRLATLEDASLRDPERALALAERVVAIEPDDPDYESTYGACLYYNGRYEDSIVVNERALALSEDLDRDPAEVFFLAMAHARLGDLPRARSWLARGDELISAATPPSAELVRLRDEARAVLESR